MEVQGPEFISHFDRCPCLSVATHLAINNPSGRSPIAVLTLLSTFTDEKARKGMKQRKVSTSRSYVFNF